MREIPVLDEGLVKLVGFTVDLDDLEEYWDDLPTTAYCLDLNEGLEAQIVRAARASYTGGTKTYREDAQLIDYLIRHGHWSPFEMVQVKFYIRAPLFVVQQFLRHRTFSFNQESARYSVLQEEAYRPQTWRVQDPHHRQGSLEAEIPEAHAVYEEALASAFQAYRKLLDLGVAREMARMVLPTATYTSLYVRGDLRNWLHFLKLRLHPHAQWEIRQYAEAIRTLLGLLAPRTMASWENHVLHAVTFSQDELEGAVPTPSRKRELKQKLARLKEEV